MLIFAGSALNQNGHPLEIMGMTMLSYLLVNLANSSAGNVANQRVLSVEGYMPGAGVACLGVSPQPAAAHGPRHARLPPSRANACGRRLVICFTRSQLSAHIERRLDLERTR
ncbi:MAG TPA: hypothetical protein VHL98_05045 [Microvirga sp.]|nr:hypothetical protein [Microvirga sp.]